MLRDALSALDFDLDDLQIVVGWGLYAVLVGIAVLWCAVVVAGVVLIVRAAL